MIPTARIASARDRWIARVAITMLACGVCVGLGDMLVRLDRHRSEARAARSEAAYAITRADLADVRVRQLADSLAAVPRCGLLETEMSLARRQIERLRATIAELIARGTHWHGTVSLPSLSDLHWPPWPERGWDLKCEPMRIVGGEPR